LHHCHHVVVGLLGVEVAVAAGGIAAVAVVVGILVKDQRLVDILSAVDVLPSGFPG
jgi:hypothetical protein